MSSEYVSSKTDFIEKTHFKDSFILKTENNDQQSSSSIENQVQHQRSHIKLPSSLSSLTEFPGKLSKLTFNNEDFGEDKDEWMKAVQDLRRNSARLPKSNIDTKEPVILSYLDINIYTLNFENEETQKRFHRFLVAQNSSYIGTFIVLGFPVVISCGFYINSFIIVKNTISFAQFVIGISFMLGIVVNCGIHCLVLRMVSFQSILSSDNTRKLHEDAKIISDERRHAHDLEYEFSNLEYEKMDTEDPASANIQQRVSDRNWSTDLFLLFCFFEAFFFIIAFFIATIFRSGEESCEITGLCVDCIPIITIVAVWWTPMYFALGAIPLTTVGLVILDLVSKACFAVVLSKYSCRTYQPVRYVQIIFAWELLMLYVAKEERDQFKKNVLYLV